MTAPNLIHEWDKNSREVVRLTIETFNGREIFNLRTWFRPEGGGNLRPGKGGIAMSVHHLPQLQFAASKAVAATAPGKGSAD